MRKKNLLPITLLFTAAVFAAACSKQDSTADYKKEAAAICEVHNPANWKDLPTDAQPQQIQAMHAEKLRAALKSEAMKNIIVNIPKVQMDQRYHYVAEAIAKLTGEPFVCPAMESYLSPGFTVEKK